MEWIVAGFITVLLAATLFVVRRSGRNADFTLSADNRYDRDLNLRTRMAEDEARVCDQQPRERHRAIAT